MKSPIRSRYLIFVLLIALTSSCVPALAPATPTFSASPMPSLTPKPTSTSTPLPSVTPTSSPTTTATVPSNFNELPSFANIQSIEFIGKKFELKYKNTNVARPIYEYYPSDQDPDDWFELVDIEVFPIVQGSNQPIDFAHRTADAFIKQYPDMHYSLLTKDNSDEVILDFFYPTATREGYLEFDAFKYFMDPNSSHVLAFHYAKNIESINSSRSFDDVLGDIRKTIKEIEQAMADFNLFSQ